MARRLLLLLAALTALVLAGASSALAAAAAQNGVRAFQATDHPPAGLIAAEKPCTRPGSSARSPEIASGFCVAAEEGSSAIEQAASKVPDEWGPGQPARSGGGWRWIPNKGDYVRVDPGNPDSADPLQQVDHVHVTSNGQVVADHLPLSEWLQWGSWNQP
jgi:hypothetical protein